MPYFHDGMTSFKSHILLEKMLDAKIVVFATPNYFYNMFEIIYYVIYS